MVTRAQAARAASDVEGRIWEALDAVPDPEIPAVSVVEMGMIQRVDVASGRARIVVLPTFTGCPAIDVIKRDVEQAASNVPDVDEAQVETSFEPPWTTDRISNEGRRKLKEFGLSPPTGEGPVLITNIGLPVFSVCPYCGSKNTRNDNVFGPTPCRALYYCLDCRNPFEQFKPV